MYVYTYKLIKFLSPNTYYSISYCCTPLEGFSFDDYLYVCMLQMSEPPTTQEGLRQGGRANKATGVSLEDAFGTGKGKHAGKKRRRHSNKYSSESKAAEIDPWEQQLRQSAEQLGAAEALEKAQQEELEERRIQRRIERGLVEYPDEEDIDPYDPSTFGYIQVSCPVGPLDFDPVDASTDVLFSEILYLEG